MQHNIGKFAIITRIQYYMKLIRYDFKVEILNFLLCNTKLNFMRRIGKSGTAKKFTVKRSMYGHVRRREEGHVLRRMEDVWTCEEEGRRACPKKNGRCMDM